MSEHHRESGLGQELAEAVLKLTDQELLEVEPDFEALAQSGREAMRAALKSHRRQVRDAYSAANLHHREKSNLWLPPKAAQRALLEKVLRRNPDLKLTLQHRELREFDDQDVEGLLRNLAELGLELKEFYEKE